MHSLLLYGILSYLTMNYQQYNPSYHAHIAHIVKTKKPTATLCLPYFLPTPPLPQKNIPHTHAKKLSQKYKPLKAKL